MSSHTCWFFDEALPDSLTLVFAAVTREAMRDTLQGSIVTLILANICLHYVLHLRFQRKWRFRTACADTIIVRYADDFVIGFRYKWDAEWFLHDLKKKLASFSLELHLDKTRLIEFGKFAMADRKHGTAVAENEDPAPRREDTRSGR